MDCANQALLFAAVADDLACGIDPAVQCGFRDDPPTPNRRQQVVFADHLFPIADQVEEQIKDLGLDVDRIAAAR